MTIVHNLLMQLTKKLPMKTIVVNDQEYLQRYFVSELADGTQLWLHRFLSNDSEEHLHTHPWNATSFILTGSYIEERPDGLHGLQRGDCNVINKDTLHRIVEVLPNTWTMMIVQPDRADTWAFIEEDGSTNTQQASARDWYKKAEVRA